MAQFFGIGNEINRFLGLCDQDDATNLPVGLAPVCRNMMFSLTSARTRDGINKTIHGLNQSPITGLMGLVYQPESETEDSFQLPLLFDMHGMLQAEYFVGHSETKAIIPSLIPLPENSHMIGSQAYNKAWLAFSNLIKPTGRMAVYNMKTDILDPFGMKPFGWLWTANTDVLLGEVACPSNDGGNGHTYRCIKAGTTGAVEPVWPTAEGATVNDGSAQWEEHTAVLANRLAPPPAPTLALAAGGSLTAGADVWIRLTYMNDQGETTASDPAMITTSAGNQAINVTTPGLLSFSQWIQDLPFQYVPKRIAIYVAVVPHGAPQPPGTAYYQQQVFTLTPAPTYTLLVDSMPTGPQLGYASGILAGTTVSQSVSILVPDDCDYNHGQWEVASVSPHQLRTTGSVDGGPEMDLDYVVFKAKSQPFAIPSGVIISQIQISFDYLSQQANYSTIKTVTLYKAGVAIGTAQVVNRGFTSATQTLTLQMDVSGLTSTDLNDQSFGFGVQVHFKPGASDSQRLFMQNGGMKATYAQPNSKTTSGARITPGQLPSPPAPALKKVPGVGSFPIHRDVYVCLTYTNKFGETLPGVPGAAYDTATDDAILVTLANPGNYEVDTINVYEADVPRGAGQPAFSQFALVGSYGANQDVTINQTASGPPPPIANTTGPGGQIAADTPTGGINSTQGYRYAAIQFVNRNDTTSGFTKNSVIKYDVDQNGWQLGIFNVPTGPANVAARQVAFTVADGTSAGDFYAIGGWASNSPDSFVYPQTKDYNGVAQTSTVFGDNVTTTGIFNFTDSYLLANLGKDVTDRLRAIWPHPGVDVYYSENSDRIFVTGVPGWNGHWVSLKADPETFYGDSCFIGTNNSDGERAICVREYRGSIYSFRERSAYVIQAHEGDPDQWDIPVRRWSKVGPCGPRAVDVCDDFMIFVHRSGVYRYVDTEPDLMTKEIPKLWKTINWSAQETICCKIDRERHEVHILVPVGNSTVPNADIVINYLEGWQNPIHFSPYAQREVSMDAARRYSVWDVAAFVCERIERVIPEDLREPYLDGVSGIDQRGLDFYRSQFVYGSSASDGLVHAITPGVYQDNGKAIPWEYETVAPQQGLAPSKVEGFQLNAKGNGTIIASLVGGRKNSTDTNPDGSPVTRLELQAKPFDLSPDQQTGISRNVPSRISERWRLRLRGDRTNPLNYVELKWAKIYTLPIASARSRSEG